MIIYVKTVGEFEGEFYQSEFIITDVKSIRFYRTQSCLNMMNLNNEVQLPVEGSDIQVLADDSEVFVKNLIGRGKTLSINETDFIQKYLDYTYSEHLTEQVVTINNYEPLF